mgnify:CR=1 FL=1
MEGHTNYYSNLLSNKTLNRWVSMALLHCMAPHCKSKRLKCQVGVAARNAAKVGHTLDLSIQVLSALPWMVLYGNNVFEVATALPKLF